MTISEEKAAPLCLRSETNSSQSIEPLSKKKKKKSFLTKLLLRENLLLIGKGETLQWLPAALENTLRAGAGEPGYTGTQDVQAASPQRGAPSSGTCGRPP